ncbi:olfactory receptor 5V1-like [Alligator mississippiensis]|uniref:olfactory receptor 5V1-like n=1 Tax=Alligator mississippiensis TaxID=8496 RepID=UPI002878121F|nr:olfactory receptor 5V1-like [Alligator mississippiensis]
MGNQAPITEFIFLGFLNHPELPMLFFLVFLVIYMVTLLGNALILTLVKTDPSLQKPMYFFLSNLSFLDICYTSATIPVMLVNFFRSRKTISYDGCITQLFFLITCAGTECVLLAVMAYDRYVAICSPLHYLSVMSRRVSVQLAGFSWLCGLVNSLVHTLLTSTLAICRSNQLSHFFCDVPLLLKLSCSETYINETVLHLASALIGLSPCLFTLVSYVLIVGAILKIRSAKGRFKAFSTCTLHLVVVIIFYGTANFNYNRPSSGYSLDVDTLVSSLYCIVTPMLNPLIYSLRNKEVKDALKRMGRKYFPSVSEPSNRQGTLVPLEIENVCINSVSGHNQSMLNLQ